MQAIAPVTTTLLKAGAQKLLYKLEVYAWGTWYNLSSLGGENYLGDGPVRISFGGPGDSIEPVGGTWSAEIQNPNGMFHPANTSATYHTLLRMGRKVRISVGATYGGVDYYWQRLIGYMDTPEFHASTNTVMISGMDYMQSLVDMELRNPNNFWGSTETLSSVASTATLDSELYLRNDSVATLTEADDMSGWVADDPTRLTSSESEDGGSDYVAVLSKAAGVANNSAYEDGAGGFLMGTLYKVSFTYCITEGSASAEFHLRFYDSTGTHAQGSFIGKSTIWTTGSFYFTATDTGQSRIFAEIYDATLVAAGVEFDEVSVKEVTGHSNTNYILPVDCNGPYFATLDGEAIFFNDPAEKDGWLYEETSRMFSFVEDAWIDAGTNNLIVYYYTTQIAENVLADILVTAGLYATQAAALAGMSYTVTSVTIPRVWFEAGTTCRDAIQMICERVNYRFWFDCSGVPNFHPAPTETSPVDFAFDDAKYVSEDRTRQDLDLVRNRIVITGISQAMFSTREDMRNSRFEGNATHAESVLRYGEKTHTIENHLFQTQAIVNSMATTLALAWGDAHYYADVTTPACPVPLEMGDTISWTLPLNPATPTTATPRGIIRNVDINGSQTTYVCEVITDIVNPLASSAGVSSATATGTVT
jgi:hypothetical protein